MIQVGKSHRMVLRLDENGVTVYGNANALLELSERLQRIAAADASECYEHHVVLNQGNPFLFEELNHREVVVTFGNNTFASFFGSGPKPGVDSDFGFELTFMHVTDAGLDEESTRTTSD